MIILNKNSKLANISEVGEDDVIINYMDKEYIVHLSENNKETIHKLVTEQGMFTVAFDVSNNRLLLDNHTEWNEETLYEVLQSRKGDM